MSLALAQAALGLHFRHTLSKRRPPSPSGQWPRACVLLSLRGRDPRLAENLEQLALQDYPDYEIRIVVDSPTDPAWDTVNSVLGGDHRVHFEALRAPSTNCSLKAAALLQMTRDLHPGIEVLAFLDGDVQLHTGWLRELVYPLKDREVGVAFGNRWYRPADASLGSLVRYLWNACAVVPMNLHGMPWGGSMAMPTRVFQQSGLPERLACSLSTDAPVKSCVQSLGLKTRFVPTLMMVNQESCSLPECLDFITRQLHSTRLYHPQWWAIIAHALYTSIPFFSGLFLAVCGLWKTAVALLFYATILLLVLEGTEKEIDRILFERGESTPKPSWSRFQLLLVVPVAQLVHLICTFRATRCRKIVWRGVTYEIAGPWCITRVQGSANR